MLELLRLMFPYMVLVCLAAILIGMANARGHFFVPALGAVLLNVIMIASVLFLAPRLGKSLEQQIFGLGYGVVLAGLAQAFFQVPSLRREGFRYQWISPWRDPTVREVVRKMLPGSIGVISRAKCRRKNWPTPCGGCGPSGSKGPISRFPTKSRSFRILIR